jgi:hypothetical protein
MVCVRTAWLVLGAQSVALDNPAGGWYCESLDLGTPVPRTVMFNRPDTDGATDLTMYMAGRTVTASIKALAPFQIDAIAAGFAPFMVPSARPTLHYVLDRPGAAERTLTLRGDSYGWPIAGPVERTIALQWIAADPIVRDVVVKTATAWSGSTVGAGRTYNLTFNRVYPVGGGAQVNATVATSGDVAVSPKLTVYGPITTPQVGLSLQVAGTLYALYFVSGFRIDVGHRVEIDTAAHTAFYDGDPTQSVLSSIDWRYFNTAGYVPSWPLVPPAPESAVLTLSGTSTSSSTQAVATWQDGYLT